MGCPSRRRAFAAARLSSAALTLGRLLLPSLAPSFPRSLPPPLALAPHVGLAARRIRDRPSVFSCKTCINRAKMLARRRAVVVDKPAYSRDRGERQQRADQDDELFVDADLNDRRVVCPRGQEERFRSWQAMQLSVIISGSHMDDVCAFHSANKKA